MSEIGNRWRVRIGIIITDHEDEPNDAVLDVPSRLGLSDCELWRRGDPRSANRVYRQSGFRYDAFDGYNEEPLPYVRKLVDRLLLADGGKILKPFDGEIAINLKILRDEAPDLVYEKLLLSNIASLGLDLDLDLYIWNTEFNAHVRHP